MSNTEQIIQNLIEGAQRAGARVEFKPSCGRESKLAIDTSTYIGGVPIAGPLEAAIHSLAETGNVPLGLSTGLGSFAGQIGGGLFGRLAGRGIAQRLTRDPNIGQMLGTLGGAIGGGMLGAGAGRGLAEKLSADTSTYLGGMPLIGPGLAGLSTAAGTGNMGGGLLSGMGSGLGQLAGGTAGAGLGGLAGKHIAQLLDADKHDRELAEMLGTGLGGLGGVIGGGMLGSAGGRAMAEPTKQGFDTSTYLGGLAHAHDAGGVLAGLNAAADTGSTGAGLTTGLGSMLGQRGGESLSKVVSPAIARLLSANAKTQALGKLLGSLTAFGAPVAGGMLGAAGGRGFAEKLSADTSTYLGGMPFGPLASGISAGMDTGSIGTGLATGVGSGIGQVGGTIGGAGFGGIGGYALARLLHTDPRLMTIGGSVLGGLGGGAGGGMLGAAGGRGLAEKLSALQSVYLNGAHTAFDQYGIEDQQKLAIWGQLAGLAGGLAKNPGVRNFAKDVAMQAGTGLAANKLMNTVSPQQ